MIPIPEIIIKKGIELHQLVRGKKSCIYQQKSKEYYEVFIIRIKKSRILFDKFLPDKEWFPNDESFGKFAWCYSDFKKAWLKFKKLEDSNNG